MGHDKIVFFRDVAGEWRWRYRSSNGRTLADSGEGYSNFADAKTACAVVCNRLLMESDMASDEAFLSYEVEET